MTENEREGVNSLLLEMAWFNFDNVLKRKENLENKANFILVACGVILSLQVFTFGKMPVGYTIVTEIGFIISAILTVFVLGLEEYPIMGVMNTWREFKKDNLLDNPQEAEKRILASLDDIILANIKKINDKSNFYKYSYIVFTISLLFLLGGLISMAFS